MLKIDYKFTARQPIFTGADEKHGTMQTLRREDVYLPDSKEQESAFASEEQRLNTLVEIIHSVWRAIDFEGMDSMRRMKIYDEFASKMLASTTTKSKHQFLDKICAKFDIRSLKDESIVRMIDMFDDEEFLDMIRTQHQYIILLLRLRAKQKNATLDLFADNSEQGKVTFKRSKASIPYISGNSIRGILRRIIMRDFTLLADIKTIEKQRYHMLFTGGNITDSTEFEDIQRREEMIEMCPPLALLGSAIGNMTIESDMKVGGARLLCKEYGTGDASFWELIGEEFGTRSDSSKTERTLEIVGAHEGKSANQMIYSYETFLVGAEFGHSFAVTTTDELTISCFWRMIKLFKEQCYLGGSSATGNGRIDIDLEVPEGADKAYVEYIKEKKDDIRKFWDLGASFDGGVDTLTGEITDGA